ncbi:hypothetical protein LCGC14_0389130 [marine sediment metagenome]|uniref:Uncharacterized protein n=1 Tax=marine sediment metagenome TaxID=412755 RepID=A0A0F9TI69_9ZZZZ
MNNEAPFRNPAAEKRDRGRFRNVFTRVRGSTHGCETSISSIDKYHNESGTTLSESGRALERGFRACARAASRAGET